MTRYNPPFLDRKTKILSRNGRAVKLGFIEFKMVAALIDNHAIGARPMNTNALRKIVWPATHSYMTPSAFGVILHNLNFKLKHIDVRVISYYPLENKRVYGKEYTIALVRHGGFLK
jgi:hypothetical protein